MICWGREGAVVQQILSATHAGQCVRMKSEVFEEFQNNRHILDVISDTKKTEQKQIFRGKARDPHTRGWQDSPEQKERRSTVVKCTPILQP